MARLSLVATILAALAAPAHAQNETWKISKDDLRAILEKRRKKDGVPALGAAVVTRAGLVQLAVTGVRKRGSEVSVEETDRFHLGSETKAMTAMLCAILVQKKVLSYDRTLADSFPEAKDKLPARLRGVTLRQLLTHRSGLPANIVWEKIPTTDSLLAQREEVVRRLEKVKSGAKPGEKFLYSNLGYVLAATVAERATRKSWEVLLAEHVTKPLKMTTAGYGAPGTKGKVDQPWPHDA
jgi:CubicO group peptidase (beta-lactamase class C family)